MPSETIGCDKSGRGGGGEAQRVVCTLRTTSSRIKPSEADNASKGNLGMVEMCTEGEYGAARKPLGRIELSGTIPAPAAEAFEARTVERVSKGGRDATINCVCSVCAGVMFMGRRIRIDNVNDVFETLFLHQPESLVCVFDSGCCAILRVFLPG